jgi:photosystem II stability/assembly factor-like uncharacterized protein
MGERDFMRRCQMPKKTTSRWTLSALAASIVFSGLLGSPPQGYARQAGPGLFDRIPYRYIGPVGNRVSAVAGVPGNPKIYYAGGASGGVWKTTDGGVHWAPVFDDQPVQSIGSLAVAPSDERIVWAGTGEAHIRSNVSIGNGIYKSVNGGKTWSHMGLERSGRIGRIVINSDDPDIVFAAALGHCYGPQAERGVFRTTDGGRTWEKVLFVDEDTGCGELAMDPRNPRILFAGMWQLVIRTWGRESGGPGSGLFKSTDGGSTWMRLAGRGLPSPPLGKIAVAVAPNDSRRVYALIETGDGVPWKGRETSRGVLWRSDDGGETWELVNESHELNQRPHYYSRIVVAPDDADEIYFCAVRHLVSTDGGRTYRRMPPAGRGDDHHDMWIDPVDGDRMIVGSDHHVNISVNRGQSWMAVALPIAQMYHVDVDRQIPYFVYGTRQDGPSVRGPSNSLRRGWSGGDILPGMWQSVGGFEAGVVVPDPVDDQIVWSGMKGGGLDRYDRRTGHARSVRVWPDSREGTPAAEVKYRFQWTAPIVISPHDHNKVYIGSQFVHQTTDGGQIWTVISPDLSTNDKSKQQSSGGLTPDNDTPEYACVIFSLAESPLEKGVLWAGTNDGLVHVTRDGGARWTDVTPNIPGLPRWGTVSDIEPSRHHPGSCYLTVDFHQVNDRDPYVYKTGDYGRSWTSIRSDIPAGVFSYAHCIREDPAQRGLLYLGTENGIYVSWNDGKNWLPLQANLPRAPVHDLIIQEHFNDLVVATYGRGFWILDDVTPLQQLTPEILEADVHLFAPRPAYRFLSRETVMDNPDHGQAGQNPPAGASLNYHLRESPAGEVRLSILDEQGRLVRMIPGTKEAGLNRVWWDLRLEPSARPRLRTSPLYAPQVKPGPEGWRPLLGGGGPVSYRVAPGTYTVKLVVDGEERVQKLIVKKDPNSAGTEADIRVQVSLLAELREMSESVVGLVDQMEWIRKQIDDLKNVPLDDKAKESILDRGRKLDQGILTIEGDLIELRLTGGSQDWLRWPARFYAKLGSLAGGVGATDFPPTSQQTAVAEMYRKQWAGYRDRFDSLLKNELPILNNLLRERNLPAITLLEVANVR